MSSVLLVVAGPVMLLTGAEVRRALALVEEGVGRWLRRDEVPSRNQWK